MRLPYITHKKKMFSVMIFVIIIKFIAMCHMTEEEDKFISRCTPFCFVVLSSSLVCVHFSLTFVMHYLSQAQGRYFWWQRFKGKENHQKGTEIRHCVTKGNVRNNERYCLCDELFMVLILFYHFICMTLKCFHTNILLIMTLLLQLEGK